MGYIKAILVTVVVALAIVFMIQNMEVLKHPLALRLNLLFVNFESSPFATYLVILLTFFAGLLIASLLGITERLGLRKELRQARKKAEGLQGELNSLRNLPLTEEPVASPKGKKASTLDKSPDKSETDKAPGTGTGPEAASADNKAIPEEKTD